MATYDSTADTQAHIDRVRELLFGVAGDLQERGFDHDSSKLGEVEKPIFDRYTPKLKTSTYGSREYKGYLKSMGAALDHHYANNDHHPEYFPNGVDDMGLVQVVEMLCDWKAASERHDDGDIRRSIEQNQERFGYGDEFKRLLLNTVDYLGW